MTKNLPLEKNLQSEPSLATLSENLVNGMALYHAHCLLSHDELHPAQAANRIREQIHTTLDATERAALKLNLTGFEGTGAEAASHATRSAVLAAYAPVREAVLAYLDAAIPIANGYVQAALADEAALFNTWAMPVVPTIISKHALAFLAT